jgi:hypothetical protein
MDDRHLLLWSFIVKQYKQLCISPLPDQSCIRIVAANAPPIFIRTATVLEGWKQVLGQVF